MSVLATAIDRTIDVRTSVVVIIHLFRVADVYHRLVDIAEEEVGLITVAW